MIEGIKSWYYSLSNNQKAWITLSTLAIFLLGITVGDAPMNIAIGTVGMFYVSVYSTGARGNFLLGVLYVSLYTFICLQNRVMLDALQNIVLIPIYIASYIHWGKAEVRPTNLDKKSTALLIFSAVMMLIGLYFLSLSLHGNYSFLDSLNTTMTMYAMITGYFGLSITWLCWSVNNVSSAIVFGLALATPTGSIAVFAMKLIFCINGFIGWYNFRKLGKNN